ncbi:acyloxyacyl hydrolase [Candidatus Pelagibacter sp.]|nr:acyloxyacyl hydrolase [Candidatus Pelagibacter sp.]
MKFYLKILVFFILLFSSVSADDKNFENKWSLFTGTFDFSDEGAKSTLYGVQYINLNNHYDSFLGKLYPVTGFFLTVDNAKYIYKGFQTTYDKGSFNITPSFTPGLYDKGNGKDLRHVIEFKTEIQISYNISKKSEIALSYNHISNANLGDNNPGANSYMLNFLKKF